MVVVSEFSVKAPVEKVWSVVTDPGNVILTIPGSENVEAVGPDVYRCRVGVRVAYLTARFDLTAKIEEQQPPSRIVVAASGGGIGLVGHVSLKAVLELAPADGETVVKNTAELTVSGTLANLGQRIIRGKVEEMAREWTQRMKELVERQAA